MNKSFVKEFNDLPMNGRMISHSDLEKVYQKHQLADGKMLIPHVHSGTLGEICVFNGCVVERYHNYSSSIVAIDVINMEDFKGEFPKGYFFVDSSKFGSQNYREDLLYKLGEDYGFVELLDEHKDFKWVLYDRNVYDIGLRQTDFFLYLKPNVFIDYGYFLYPPIANTKLLGADCLFRFSYAQNIFRNIETYFKYTYKYLNVYNSKGQVSIFANSIIPGRSSIKELVEYLDSLFKEDWSRENCVFDFSGTIFCKGATFGRKIAWEMGTGQFSGKIDYSNREQDLLVRQFKPLGISVHLYNVIECFRDPTLGSFYDLVQDTGDPDIDWIVNCSYESCQEELSNLPEDFNSCVFVVGIGDSGYYGLKPDFRYRNLKNFIIPNEQFLNSGYDYSKSKTPFVDSILYSIDFNGFCCTPETFNRSVLHESFKVKGGLKLKEGEDYSKMFNLCNYKALTGRDFRSVLKLVQSPPSDKSGSNSEDSSDVLNELKGWIKSGYSLGEAKVLLNSSGISCDDVVEKLHDSLLDVCSKFIDILLNPGEDSGSSTEFTIGLAQKKLLSKGYPKDIVNEAIVEYIKDEYLVSS